MPPRSSERRPSQGVGNPLEWSVIERCRVMILMTLPFYVGYALRSAYLITHPEVEPYFSRAWLVIMREAIAGLVAFWIAFLALGSLERRRPGPHTLYALVGTLSWWVGAGAVAYGLGPITSQAWIGIIFGVVCQLLLLPQAMALGGIAFGLFLVVASMVAVGLGAVPYAPMMSAARECLEKRGVAAARIHEERFVSAHASTAPLAPQEVLVRLEGRERKVTVTPGRTVLESALDAGVEMPFSCAVGGCGTCRSRLVAGSVVFTPPRAAVPPKTLSDY